MSNFLQTAQVRLKLNQMSPLPLTWFDSFIGFCWSKISLRFELPVFGYGSSLPGRMWPFSMAHTHHTVLWEHHRFDKFKLILSISPLGVCSRFVLLHCKRAHVRPTRCWRWKQPKLLRIHGEWRIFFSHFDLLHLVHRVNGWMVASTVQWRMDVQSDESHTYTHTHTTCTVHPH